MKYIKSFKSFLILEDYKNEFNSLNGKSPYDILGVNKDASEQEIKTIYRQLMKKYHPDVLQRNETDEERTLLTQFTSAYNILSNKEYKYRYDNKNYDDSKKSENLSTILNDEFFDTISKIFYTIGISKGIHPKGNREYEFLLASNEMFSLESYIYFDDLNNIDINIYFFKSEKTFNFSLNTINNILPLLKILGFIEMFVIYYIEYNDIKITKETSYDSFFNTNIKRYQLNKKIDIEFNVQNINKPIINYILFLKNNSKTIKGEINLNNYIKSGNILNINKSIYDFFKIMLKNIK